MNKKSTRTSFISICTSNSLLLAKPLLLLMCVRDLESLFEVHVARGEHPLQTLAFHNIFTSNFKITSLNPLMFPSFISTTEVLQPLFSQYLVYILTNLLQNTCLITTCSSTNLKLRFGVFWIFRD
jgi:hypothetical protein